MSGFGSKSLLGLQTDSDMGVGGGVWEPSLWSLHMDQVRLPREHGSPNAVSCLPANFKSKDSS